MEADQEFFTDLYSVTIMSIKGVLFRWPPHKKLADKIGSMKRKRIGCCELRMLFPEMYPSTLSSIVQHYRSFEPIRRKTPKAHHEDDPAHVMMTQISVMLGVAIPTLHEALSSSAALQRQGFQRCKDDNVKKEQMLEALVQQQVSCAGIWSNVANVRVHSHSRIKCE